MRRKCPRRKNLCIVPAAEESLEGERDEEKDAPLLMMMHLTDESDEEEEDTDLEGFIDHDDMDSDDPAFYRTINQQCELADEIRESMRRRKIYLKKDKRLV